MKTAELTGAALDWAVAKADDNLHPRGSIRILDGKVFFIEPGNHEVTDAWVRYSPSTSWAQGGPIGEREHISAWYQKSTNNWFAEKRHFGRYHHAGRSYAEGPTELSAKMRCYVASKLGDEIDIPEELT